MQRLDDRLEDFKTAEADQRVSEGGPIVLPWFPKELNPNEARRLHFSKKGPVYSRAKNTAWALTKQSKTHIPGAERVSVSIVFYPPDKRRRDIDNCLAACKAYLDGIASAIGIDDHKFRPMLLDWGDVRKGGEIAISIAGEVKYA